MTDMRYYEIDVPITLTVVVQGRGLSVEEASTTAARYAEAMAPTEGEAAGYSSVAFKGRSDGLAVTGASLEITGPVSGVDDTANRLEP